MTWLISILNAISSTFVLGAITALAIPSFRDAVFRSIGGLIQLKLDRNLEHFRFELRKSEETFKSELQAIERQNSAILNTALDRLSGQQSALDERRISAIEALWKHKSKLDGAKSVSSFMHTIAFDIACQEAKKNPKVKEFFKHIDDALPVTRELAQIQLSSLESERPFLSPLVWSTFSAYNGVLTLAVVKLKLLASGFGEPAVVMERPINDLLKGVLPEYSSYVDKYGSSGHYNLLDALETKLLTGTWENLSGKSSAVEGLKNAAELVKLAEGLNRGARIDASIPEHLRADEPPSPPQQT